MEGVVPSIKYSGCVKQVIKACTKLFGKAVSYSVAVYIQEIHLLAKKGQGLLKTVFQLNFS